MYCTELSELKVPSPLYELCAHCGSLFNFQPSDRKSATKAERGKPTPSAKEKPSKEPAAEKDKKPSKKKSQSPAAAKPTTSNKSDVSKTLNSLFSVVGCSLAEVGFKIELLMPSVLTCSHFEILHLL